MMDRYDYDSDDDYYSQLADEDMESKLNKSKETVK